MLQRPRTFTSREAFINSVREELFACKRPWKDIAHDSNRAVSTIQRLASGQTKWPRDETLFPVIAVLGFGLSLTRIKDK